jgi:hypothetical protein
MLRSNVPEDALLVVPPPSRGSHGYQGVVLHISVGSDKIQQNAFGSGIIVQVQVALHDGLQPLFCEGERNCRVIATVSAAAATALLIGGR